MKDRLSFKIVNEGGRLKEKAVIEATNFNSALDKIDAGDKLMLYPPETVSW
jgi:hypothetical protein